MKTTKKTVILNVMRKEGLGNWIITRQLEVKRASGEPCTTSLTKLCEWIVGEGFGKDGK